VQEEEHLRNSKMLDLLYVSCAHKLVPHILFYYQNYSHLPYGERPVLPIDPSARLVNVLVIVISN
jgi:5'-3' exoribonuclease 2